MDKKAIDLVKQLNAPAAVVFEAMKGGQLLRSTGIIEETFKHDFRVGGEYFLNWKSLPAAKCTGRYLEIVPNERVRFTWNSENCPGATSQETIVTVTLVEKDDVCEMRLVHEGLDAGICFDDHLSGWQYTFDDLRIALPAMPNAR